MASLQPDGTNAADDLLFDMYKKAVLMHLRSKMSSEMLMTLERLKSGGVGTSDIARSKMRLESFLHSMVFGEAVDVAEISETYSHDLNSRLEAMFGAVFSKEVILGIVDVVASSCSNMPSMNVQFEKLVIVLLKFLVESACIKVKGSDLLTPPLKRKDVPVGNSPAAPVKQPSKKSHVTQHPGNVDAKVLFPEVEISDVHPKASKEPIKDIKIDSDVVILKEVSLNEKLNKMCKASDVLHKKHSMAGGKVQQGSTTLKNERSPTVSIVSEDCRCGDVGVIFIPESSRFPLSPQEKLVYNAVCSLANSKYATNTVADIGGCILKYFSLGESMAPGKEVCTYVVNAFCRKFFLDERPTVSKKHYFFSLVAEAFFSESADNSYVERSFSGAASVLPLPLCDSLFFPVMFRKHWFLFVVDLKHKWFMFLDSYYSRQDEFSTYTRKKLLDGFCRAWSMYVGSDTRRFNEFRIGYAHVPKQENEVDCGVFLIKFMEFWWYGCKMVELFSQEDIPSLRVQILFDLVYCKHNTADTKAVKDFIDAGAATA